MCAHGRPSLCRTRHGEKDEDVGEALCHACYDHEGQVLWNAHVGELWRRTIIYLRRRLAASLDLAPSELEAMARISFCKVAEFQRRGAVHLHALLRLDPMTGAVDDRLDTDQLTQSLVAGVRSVAVPVPGRTGNRSRPSARFGDELDVQALTDDTSAAAARYLAKYVSKSTGTSGVLDRPVRPGEIVRLADLPLSEQERRLVAAAWRLGGRPELVHLRLRHWAHQFGFRGHVLTKSACWSTTFAALAEVRTAWRRGRADADPSRRLEPVGWGWPLAGDAILATRRQAEWEEGRRLSWESDDEDRPLGPSRS